MAFDKKDKAIIAASSLIGYCMSVANLLKFTKSDEDFEAIKRWGDGLLNAAQLAGTAIDAALETDTHV